MGYIRGESREQVYLLPEAIDDYVGTDNPVRFLDAFVEQLDLAALGFMHATPANTGRPPYDPGDVLRLYLYGYLNRIRSSRRLEVEAGRNLELMWLLRNCDRTSRPSPIFGRSIERPSRRCAASSRCCAGGWTCLAASWSPSTAVSSER